MNGQPIAPITLPKPGDPNALPQLVEGGGVVRVIKAIQEKYGFTPTAAYVSDLIAFVETLTHADA